MFNEEKYLSNIGRGSPKEHSCEIISKSVHWFSIRSHLKVFFLFLALAAILFRRSRTVQVIRGAFRVRRLFRNIHVIFFFKSVQWFSWISRFSFFLFIALVAMLLNGAERFEQTW